MSSEFGDRTSSMRPSMMNRLLNSRAKTSDEIATLKTNRPEFVDQMIDE
jgi:hypothetical protein